MTTTNTHAAPWTLRRALAMFTPRHSTPNLLQTQSGTWSKTILTGREATARHLFGEAVQWSRLDMLEYDASPEWQAVWLAEADRRIAGANVTLPDLLVLRWWGYAPAEWDALPALVKADKREGYAQAKGLGK